jgi:hypothetical protein
MRQESKLKSKMKNLKPSEVAELTISELATNKNLLPLHEIVSRLWDSAVSEEDHYSLYYLKQLKAHLYNLKSVL